MIMDFTANNEDGSLSVSYKNLTAGDADFTAIDSWQNRDLGLRTNGSVVTPSDWDALMLRQDFYRGTLDERMADNLVVQAVPLPGALGFLVTGLISLAGVRTRNRRNRRELSG